MLFVLCVHTHLDFYSFLNFNTIMFASVSHIFDKAWTMYHNSMIVYYHYLSTTITTIDTIAQF